VVKEPIMSKTFTDDSFIYTGNHPDGDDIESQGWKDLLAELELDPYQSDTEAANLDYVDGSRIMELDAVGKSVTIKGRKVTLMHIGEATPNPGFGYWINRTYKLDLATKDQNPSRH
jgi:hypothetical protein